MDFQGLKKDCLNGVHCHTVCIKYHLFGGVGFNADIEAFLKAGGQITRVSDDDSAYPERLKKYSFVPKDYKDAKI